MVLKSKQSKKRVYGNMNYNNAIEKNDLSKIDKLNKLTRVNTFWEDVRKFTKKVTSDHSISRWLCLAEFRESELLNERKEDK